MIMKEEIKNKILLTGAQIIHHKGFNNTGIQEILQKANIPKGSFYFYFKNKEDFGLQVIDFFNGFYKERVEAIVGDSSKTPLERIRSILTGFIDLFETFNFTRGCPVGNLAQEMSDLSRPFQKKLHESFNLMTGLHAKLIVEAQKEGTLASDLDADQVAEFIVSSWHGALIRMKVEQSRRPLESHIAMLFSTVLKI